jgi:23S rRNA (uracil1939-C5)-methyltransferase
MTRPKTIELTITDIALDGSGIAEYKHQHLLIPYTIPGETITARLINNDHAEGVTLVERSVDRIRPRCRHFGAEKCGGCQWQHITYEAQIALKTDMVISALESIGNFIDPPVQMTLPSPLLWGYASQIRLLVTKEGELGLKGTDSRQVIAIEECPITQPELFAILNELDFDFDTIDELRVQLGTSGTPLLILRAHDDIPHELESEIPLSINFLLKDKEPFNLVGSTHTIQRIHNHDFRVTAGVDFRANRPQIETLVSIVLHYLNPQPSDIVLDLYGGVGIFSAFIAPHVDMVTYVDSYPPAATDAESNLNNFPNVDIIEGSVQDILEDLLDEEEGNPYTTVVVDPPYTGLTEPILDALGKLSIPRLVYVSQNVESLARDIHLLERHGYTLREVQPIDFAPQTAYIHCVALLEIMS